MVLANCNKRMSVHFTVQGQDESDVIFSAFEQTLKTVVPRVGKMSEEQLTEHLLLLHNITIKYSSSTLIVSAVGLYTSSHFTIVPATELRTLKKKKKKKELLFILRLLSCSSVRIKTVKNSLFRNTEELGNLCYFNSCVASEIKL